MRKSSATTNYRQRFVRVTRASALTACFAFLLFTVVPFTRASNGPDGSSLVSTSTREGRLAVFDDVWETIDERYYDPTFRGLDWQIMRTTFRPLAAAAKGTEEFYAVLRQMIGPLQDAHTRVYSPEEKFDWWKPRFQNVGLSIREVEGQLTVVQVEPSSAGAKAGIHPGDVILQIDDVPSSQVIARRLKQYGPSLDESTRFRVVTTLLEGTAGSPLTLSWQSQSGSVKSAKLQRGWTERRLGFQIKRSDHFALIKIDAFTQVIAAELTRALPRTLKHAQGIVLDLRANGGGDAEAMSELASVFLPDGTSLGRFADRSGASFELRTNGRSLSIVSPFPRTNLPLVVLTSESTSSAAEILVAALKKHGRARVIGTQTCGCVLAIRNRHALPDGGVLDVSELDYWTADGMRLEGAGVKPDETVTTRRQDIYSHRDEVLESAKKLLKGLEE